MNSLIATPAWQTRRQGLLAKQHPWLLLIKANADATGTAGQHYGDFGQWAAVMYAMTGDASYAQKAWTVLEPQLTTKPIWAEANAPRDKWIPFAIFYTWLAPALTPDQQQTFASALTDLVDWTFTPPNQSFERNGVFGHGGGWRVNDTDQTLSQYLGCVLTSLVLNQPAILDRTYSPCLKTEGTNGSLPLGGLVSTGLDATTVRNAIARYFAQYSAGGMLPESSQYDLNTLQNALLGFVAIRQFVPEFLGELAALLPDIAKVLTTSIEPGRKSCHSWGDCEADEEMPNLFQARKFRRLSTHLLLLGVMGHAVDAAPLAQLTNNLLGNSLVDGLNGPDWRWTLTADPATLTAAGPTVLTTHYADGAGLLHARDGLTAVWFHAPKRYGIDHEHQWFGNFQLCRAGEWLLKSLVGYGGLAMTPYAANTLAICGLGSMHDCQVLAYTANAKWTYLCCRTRGPLYGSDYFRPPREFLSDWTRRLLYDWNSQTLVVDDSVTLAFDPRQANDFSRYRRPDQEAMRAAGALVESTLHMPVQPVTAGSKISWLSPGGAHLHVDILSPSAPTIVALQESVLWPTQKNFAPNELGWQIRLHSESLTSRLCYAIRVQDKPNAVLKPDGVGVGNSSYTWNDDGTLST